MQLDWRIIDGTDKDNALAAVNPYLGIYYALDSDASAVRIAQLPFYSNFRFLELTDLRPRQPKSMFALHRAEPEGETYVLDWTNHPIYTTNERDPIRLDQQNVVTYLEFFFACVQGPYGPMTVVENLEPPADASPDVYNMADALLGFCPPKVVGRTAGGGYVIKGPMLFKDCVFMTRLEVGRNGFIRITDHELSLGGLTSAEQTGVKAIGLE
jgi:hypothetical protein